MLSSLTRLLRYSVERYQSALSSVLQHRNKEGICLYCGEWRELRLLLKDQISIIEGSKCQNKIIDRKTFVNQIGE